MHRLVQLLKKKPLEPYNELEEWERLGRRFMDDKYPVGWHENWTVCQSLFPHPQASVQCPPTDGSLLIAGFYRRYYEFHRDWVLGTAEQAERPLFVEQPSDSHTIWPNPVVVYFMPNMMCARMQLSAILFFKPGFRTPHSRCGLF